MDPAFAEALAPLLAMVALGGAVLIGMKMRYNYLAKIRAGGADKAELARVTETVERLRDEVGDLREVVVELGERVDFTERVLARKTDKDAPALPGRDG